MLKFGITLNTEVLVKNLFLIFNFILLILNISTFFKKKKKDRGVSKIQTEEEKEREEKIELLEEKQRNVEFKTIVIEEPKRNNEITKVKVEKMRKELLLIPSQIENQIEKIVLKILYEERAVKTLKLLNDKVLENAAREKVTVSEKVINQIITQMNKTEKIEFTQKEGWKIMI